MFCPVNDRTQELPWSQSDRMRFCLPKYSFCKFLFTKIFFFVNTPVGSDNHYSTFVVLTAVYKGQLYLRDIASV